MYTLAPHISTTDTDYGTVLLDEERGKYWNLNPSGSLILKAVLRGGDAISVVLSEFEAKAEEVESDVEQLVGALVSAGILIPSGAGHV
ncbi:lasso peptide biosynthesis PqqD family chaperone [Nonomuraea endophytica]|uniref:lasso peptide biosynthesis PqqD family chaperone n=1 Tax=Nonomuraea endophytica TaxID=714136 RepID=UPI0037C5EEA6